MAKGEQKGTGKPKKPKKEKIKTIAAAPSQKAAGWNRVSRLARRNRQHKRQRRAIAGLIAFERAKAFSQGCAIGGADWPIASWDACGRGRGLF